MFRIICIYHFVHNYFVLSLNLSVKKVVKHATWSNKLIKKNNYIAIHFYFPCSMDIVGEETNSMCYNRARETVYAYENWYFYYQLEYTLNSLSDFFNFHFNGGFKFQIRIKFLSFYCNMSF